MIGFGEFGKQRTMEIKTLRDKRLLKVDPTATGFFDKVLGYISENEDIKAFIEAVKEVKESKLSPFWRPVLDPTFDGEDVIFKKGGKPAVGHSFNWWQEMAKKMATVEGKKWTLGTEYQYYAFLVWLINQLVKSGWRLKKAIEACVLDSKELGHYCNSENALHNFEVTGSCEVCGVCDLANTVKILRCSNEKVDCFWLAGGNYSDSSRNYPLAELSHDVNVNLVNNYSVPWLVLS